MPTRNASRLPSYSTPFIGRNDEIVAIAKRLSDPDCHLLTLVGAGGMGKTRLAVEVAKGIAQTAAVANGICFVDLQPVNSGDLLMTAIANAVGVLIAGSEEPRLQLLRYLGDHEMLLLLDNFEQLLDSVDLLADIVKIAPGVKMLVTSREALNIEEEWVWRVGGLEVPDSQPEANIEIFSAVQLFVERARRARQDFTLEGQESSITRICQLVDGMPLALELAASWTKVLSCAEIADEIQRSLDFLTTNMRNVPERHRNMQAVFNYSWQNLTEDERAVFPKLSIFRGGFRREAAEQVAGASLVVLAGLVDKSFLRVNTTGRYEIQELMRQYGEERLEDEAKKESQNRHCVYYAGFLHMRQLPLRGWEQARALDEIGDELDNLRVSWEWIVEHDMRDEIHRSMHSFFVFCHIRAQAVEGERLFEMAVQRFEREDSATLAYLILARSWLAWDNGRSVGVDEHTRAIRLIYSLWNRDEIAMPLGAYCPIDEELKLNTVLGDQQKERVYRDYLEIFRQHDQHWGVAWMMCSLGEIFFNNCNLDEAENYYRQSLDGFLKLGDHWGSAWPSKGLADVFEASQQYPEALQQLQEHQDSVAEVGDRGGVVYTYANKARISWKMQDYHTARIYIASGIQSHLESGSLLFHLCELLRSFIAVLVSENRPERAVEMVNFLRQQADKAQASGILDECDQKLASLAQQLQPDIYQQAVERGKTLHIKTILEQLQGELSDYSPLAPAAPQLDALTERELEVLRLVASGRSNRQIAHDLVLTLNTVKSHIHHIYGKLGVESRVQAVTRARELHLLS